MGLNASGGNTKTIGFPYTKVYVAPTTTIDLTEEIAQARKATASLTFIAVGAGTVTFVDTRNQDVAITLDDNAIMRLDVAAVALKASANITIIASWYN